MKTPFPFSTRCYLTTLLSLAACCTVADDRVKSLPRDQFTNPIAEGADPCVVKDGDRYLWCQSEGNRGVSIWVSDRPTTMGNKHMVWRAPSHGPYSLQVWAPELVKGTIGVRVVDSHAIFHHLSIVPK